MRMKFEGAVFVAPDNVDTDVIIPAKYLNRSDPEYLGAHCLEPLDERFSARIAKGDVIVAGRNFGCGSSREHAPVAIKAAGISCVVAESFARIFYRNAINIGLPLVELPGAAKAFAAGDRILVDLEAGAVRNLTRGQEHRIHPYPAFLQSIIAAGGLVPFIRARRPVA